jgi:hypothetical protein
MDMALDWRIEDIKDYKDVCYVKEGELSKLSNITEAIIFTCMCLDIGEITKTNVDEWYARLEVWHLLHGNTTQKIQPLDVYRHIGLRTNVGYVTEAKWIGKIMRQKLSEGRFHYQVGMEKAAASMVGNTRIKQGKTDTGNSGCDGE